MRSVALLALSVLALWVPESATAKGFTRAVLVGADGRSFALHAQEPVIDGLLTLRGSITRARGGYLRLFFVGPGDFPANPARYYPRANCVALDWPTYDRACARIAPELVRRLRPARALPRFTGRPTVLVAITYNGRFRASVAALKDPVELALDRRGRRTPAPKSCYAFAGRWRGPAAAARPRRFLLCGGGVYAGGRLYPLRRGVWEWFGLNVG
jgi:hypothetical protein